MTSGRYSSALGDAASRVTVYITFPCRDLTLDGHFVRDLGPTQAFSALTSGWH